MKPQSGTFKIDGRELKLTHLEKVLYPEVGFTKGQVIDYYIRAAPVLLPHLKDRPLTLKRYPNGVDGEFFYEKRAPKYRPDWLQTAEVPSAHDPTGHINYCLANDLSSLVWAANLADLELHPFLAKKQNVECPTQIVFDLDPGAPADATDCAEIALWIRAALEKLELKCFIKSSGSKGLQIHIPLNTPTSYEITKPFARAFAVAMQEAHPDRVVYDMKKTLRPGKVLIDWSQNDSSKTTILVYSLRAKPQPWVATPLTWEEVATCFKKDDPQAVLFDSEKALKRIDKMGDLFAELLTLKQKLPKDAAQKIVELIKTNPAVPATKSKAGKKAAPAAATEKADDAESGPASLNKYHAKRDFQQTREPQGVKKAPTSEASLFVIQKHDASHLHYDFRLSMGGVLKSWAVPKTIPTQKGEKHLAVEVEDHPLDYANFEGIIPAGNYGGGTVMVWDTGTYQMLGGTPLEAHQQGLLHFQLKGKKLNGEWSLIRTDRAPSDKPKWLLLKSGESVKPISAKLDDSSALTHRTMAKIAKEKDASWQSNRGNALKSHPIETKASPAPKKTISKAPAASAKPPEQAPEKSLAPLARKFVEPMKCRPREEVPEGEDWLYELKFDGYRSLAICERGEALLMSRNRKTLNPRFPGLAAEVAKLPVRNAILDGEIVAMDANNRPSFQILQNYEQGPPLLYYFFDLLELDGIDYTQQPLEVRRDKLQKLLKNVSPQLLFSGELSGTAQEVWKLIQKERLEGIIAKRRASVYEVGERSGQWAKIKAINQQDFVIAGYTEPQGSRSHFGALLVGVFEGKQLRFCGKVGTGFNQKMLASLFGQMEKLKVGKCPFFNLPTPRSDRWGGGITASEMKRCTWLQPKLIAEVQFTEWTGDGSLRHPSFLGLRDDIAATDVRRETPEA
jgi:bifunctional non-homologous end joining protein LigD